MITLFKNGMVWEEDHFCRKDIAVEAERITMTGTAPEGFVCDRTFDVEGKYLVPGVIDCHAHVTMVGGDHHMAVFFQENTAELTMEGVINCERMVSHGITTARDCGGKYMETLAIRDFIRKGKIKGPRLLCSGTPLKVVGGHEPGFDITGPIEARKAVRQFLFEGFDFIKAMVPGGLGKAGEDPGAVELELNELAAMVSEAAKHGKKVACHCHSRAGMEILLKAGAASIEHATYLDPEINEQIIRQGVYVVPTFTPYEIAAASEVGCGIVPDAIFASRAMIGDKRKRFKEAYDQGVLIAFGRDSGGFFMDQGEFADEMLYMEHAGMARKDIIKSATEHAARLLGIWGETGSLEEGKCADILFLNSNPLENLAAYRNDLQEVCANGTLILNKLG